MIVGKLEINDLSDKALQEMTKTNDAFMVKFMEQFEANTKQAGAQGSIPGSVAHADTGHNVRSIRWEKKTENAYELFTETGYGAYIEIGTVKMPARPYFAPAFEHTKRQITP